MKVRDVIDVLSKMPPDADIKNVYIADSDVTVRGTAVIHNTTFELSEEELKIIQDWYDASAGECAHAKDGNLYKLIEKLGLQVHTMDSKEHQREALRLVNLLRRR